MRKICLTLVGTILTVCAPASYACSVCFGATDAVLKKGLVLSILTLLGILLAVLAGIVSFFINLNRRTHNVISGKA